MNLKVLLIIVAGILCMCALFIFPPWKAHGVFAGHFRVDQVLWMDFDKQRFKVEQAIIVTITYLAAIMLWRK